MKPEIPADTASPWPHPHDFSLVLGGPLFQLMRRARLSDDVLMLVRRRILFFALICWLPLLVLTAVDGRLLGGSAAVPFLWDVDTHVRFLLAAPLLIVAELVVHKRMRPLARVFTERGLISDDELPRLDAALAAAFRLRNSVLAEALLVALVYGVGVLIVWRHYAVLDTTTWYATPAAGGARLSPAGLWYGYVSLPIFQFLLLRWFFRFVIWARLLWQLSRIELRLIPTHPDRAGGLGFLPELIYAFVPVLVAIGAMVAGGLANRILYVGASLVDFKLELVVLVGLLFCIVAGPLLVFSPRLAAAKHVGLRDYGTLAYRYVREFDAKWLRGGAAPGEPLLGAADVQSLADMGNSFEVVQTMRPVLITKQLVVVLAFAVLGPVAPLVLTMMPLADLLKKLLAIAL